jgi:hypothetical protein
MKITTYRTRTFPAVLHGCETWLLTLREECKLRVSENKVLRIFEPKRNEATGEWKTLHNKKLYVLYSPPNTIQMLK